VRSLIVTDPELSQVLLRAFILRRALLMKRSAGNVVLIGSRHSAGTLALQEFLTRNNQPYTYLDADHDAGVQTTLEGFGRGRGRRAGPDLQRQAGIQEADDRRSRGVPGPQPLEP
jgi:thioredoxin reductase (NADPH)